MLRIVPVASPDEAVSLRLEGQIRGPWVEELRRSCAQALATGRGLTLDMTDVSFIDLDGVALFQSLSDHNVTLLHCSLFVGEQLKGGGVMSTIFSAGRVSRGEDEHLSGMRTADVPPARKENSMVGARGGAESACADMTEQELVQRLQAGDTEAFDTLFRQHFSKVYRQALHLLGTATEAEEVVQEVFLTVYEKAHTFRGASAFTTWLYRLTVNAALSRLRRRTRRKEIALDDYLPQFRADGHHLVRPVVDWSADLEQCLANAQVQQLLWKAIELLQPLDKAVLVLSDFEDLPNREIGEALGLTVLAVKARLHRARLFLRGQLAVALGHSPA